jgi:5-methylcytosine-specific restriction endonuclease McrA
MPKAPAVCAEPGCPTLTPHRRCPEHQATRQREASRARRARDGRQHYDTSAWQARRKAYRLEHPTCTRCPAPTQHVDHVIPLRLLVAAGIGAPDADQWLQPLCERCHNHKTATFDRPLLARYAAGEDPAYLCMIAGEGVG